MTNEGLIINELDPFSGIDMVFLQTALKLASGAVYSLHKTSTREVNCTF